MTGRSRISAQGSRNKEAHSFGPEDEDDDNEDQEGSTAAAGNEEGVDYDGDAELAWQASGLSSGAWDNAPVCATVLVSRSAGRYRVQVRRKIHVSALRESEKSRTKKKRPVKEPSIIN